MIFRRDSLEQALAEIEAQGLKEITTIVVNREWWDGLPAKDQVAYRLRAEHTGVQLRADAALSSHFVELRGPDDGPPLSTERPM